MANQTKVREFKQAQEDIVRLAQRELRSYWLSLDPNTPAPTARALELYVPELVLAYGDMSAAVATDFYSDLREEAGVRKRFNAVIDSQVVFEQVAASTRWAVGPLFREIPDVGATYSNLTDVNDRLIKQQGRDTIVSNAVSDPVKVRYARVPTSAKPCDFCLMLAGRGAVYVSSASAGELNTYHGNCGCTPVPVWDE